MSAHVQRQERGRGERLATHLTRMIVMCVRVQTLQESETLPTLLALVRTNRVRPILVF